VSRVRLAEQGRIIIEVGLNEFTTKAQNANVPYGPDEVAVDATACAEAGAAVVHFHARDDDGGQDWSGVERYRRALELIAARSDVVAYPSYFGDHSHVWQLAETVRGGAGSLLASYDVPQEVVGPRLWNEGAARFEDPPFDTVGGTPPPDPLAEMRTRGVQPTVNVFDVGEARWLALAVRAGMFPRPLYVKLFLCEQLVTGPFPDARGIEAYASQLAPELDLECTVVPYTMMRPEHADMLLRAALSRGYHVRVGIGDSPYAYPDVSNAELVTRAVALVRDAGFEPASASDVRARLGLAQ
jgi:3-keto-5-aminohexanoate cleavage enzyme